MELSFSGIRTRMRENKETRRRQRHAAMVEDIAGSCRVSKERVVAIKNPETIPPAEPFVKSVVRGDVILITGKRQMALEVKNADAQGITVLAREEGMETVEHRLTPGGSAEVLVVSGMGIFGSNICTLSVFASDCASLELRTEITGGMMPF